MSLLPEDLLSKLLSDWTFPGADRATVIAEILSDITRKIAETEIKLQKAEHEEKEELSVMYGNLLVELQKKHNLLLANQSKFTLLSLFISYSNPLLSTFLKLMTNYNVLFHFLSAAVAQPAPVPTGKL